MNIHSPTLDTVHVPGGIGLVGETGVQGIQGNPGSEGHEGPAGPRGFRGPVGEKGNPGEAGRGGESSRGVYLIILSEVNGGGGGLRVSMCVSSSGVLLTLI